MSLANVISTLPDVTIRVLQEVSTDPVSDKSFFIIETDQTEAVEHELSVDHTVENAQRISRYEDWPVYSIEFTSDTELLGTILTDHGGFALTAYQRNGGWIEQWQLPDRKALQSIWQYASEQSFEFNIQQIYRISGGQNNEPTGLTEK